MSLFTCQSYESGKNYLREKRAVFGQNILVSFSHSGLFLAACSFLTDHSRPMRKF